MKFIKNQFGYLLFGVVVWLPISVIFLVLFYIFNNLENAGNYILSLFLPKEFIGHGLGIALGIIIIYLTGLIFKKTSIGNFLSKIPVLGLFFSKKGGKTITLDGLLALPPCLFLFSPTCPSYGWILSEEKVQVDGEKSPVTLINIYYPNVPTLITGQIFPVRKETVIKLGNPSREIINLLLYTVRSPENIQCFPWEDENREEFKKRVELFGKLLSLNLDTG